MNRAKGSISPMQSTQNALWHEAVARLRELEDEVKRVEELVLGRLSPHDRRAVVAAVRGAEPEPPTGPAPILSVPDAPRIVGGIRRHLDGDPLDALALGYPAGIADPDAPPERTRTACLTHHALNTARLAMFVGIHHGYQPSTVEVVGVCALLHDLGLEAVPAELFAKIGPLTPDDRRTLETHVIDGADRVRACHDIDGLLRTIVPAVVRQHHERTDGSGYPDGLDAPHIHEFARLVALAEAYETMVSPRPYKAAMLPHDAMTTLLFDAFGKGRPARLDRRLATSFVRALSLYPIGSAVRLEGGEIAQVVAANPDAPERPHVRVSWRPGGTPVDRPYVLDLRGARTAVAEALPLPRPRNGTEHHAPQPHEQDPETTHQG